MYLGINNIVALRGDAMKGEKYFEPSKADTNMLRIW
jgi:methylenetetrahydrofolate reductase (NADPH)